MSVRCWVSANGPTAGFGWPRRRRLAAILPLLTTNTQHLTHNTYRATNLRMAEGQRAKLKKSAK